jgi:hypothetical protein
VIPLDYARPQPSERKHPISSATGQYLTGLLVGLIIDSVLEGNVGPFVCGGIYSLLPVTVFYFTTFLRHFCPSAPLDERNVWLTVLTGIITAVIEYEVSNWSNQTTVPDAWEVAMAMWLLLPMIGSFASMRRRSLV